MTEPQPPHRASSRVAVGPVCLLSGDRVQLLREFDVSLRGRAKVVDDATLRARQWRDEWYAFFPDGPQGADYVLVRFEPARMELVDFSARITPVPFGLKSLALVKAEGAWRLA